MRIHYMLATRGKQGASPPDTTWSCTRVPFRGGAVRAIQASSHLAGRVSLGFGCLAFLGVSCLGPFCALLPLSARRVCCVVFGWSAAGLSFWAGLCAVAGWLARAACGYLFFLPGDVLRLLARSVRRCGRANKPQPGGARSVVRAWEVAPVHTRDPRCVSHGGEGGREG